MKSKVLYLKRTKDPLYDRLRVLYLFHSNKINGSTFSKNQLSRLAISKVVDGKHSRDDIIETRNSFELFDHIVETTGEDLSLQDLKEYHSILKHGTKDHKRGLKGKFRRNTSNEVKTGNDSYFEVELKELLAKYENESMNLEMVADFHNTFKEIHPFEDGNGRIARLIMLKQCIDNRLDFILIDEEKSQAYEDALTKGQKDNSIDELVSVLSAGQIDFKEKFGVNHNFY